MSQDASDRPRICLDDGRRDQTRSNGFRRDLVRFACAAIAFTLIIYWLSPWRAPHRPPPLQWEIKPFSWDDIHPSRELEYHSCFNGFECARLEVPLDWTRTEEDLQVDMAIAITRKPALVPVTDPRYGGVVVLNPGGPGNSGVWSMLKYGAYFQILLDSGDDIDSPDSDGKFYDILSFDSRGVNNTTPAYSCFPDVASRHSWMIEKEIVGLMFNDYITFQTAWARMQALSSSCSQIGSAGGINAIPGIGHVAEYVSTAFVVRDMVEIIERHGEWREETARELLSRSEFTAAESRSILTRTAWRKGEEMLQFWGFSYGSFLGQTFASMQPNRVGRVVCDGVVDASDYAATRWATNLNDDEEILTLFYDTCFEAGPERCALYSHDGPSRIQQTVDGILKGLKDRPLAAWTNDGPTVITHSDVLILIFVSMYTPLNDFTQTALLLADLSRGNGSAIAALKSNSRESTCSPLSVTADPAKKEDNAMAIMCTDGASVYGESQEDFLSYVSAMNVQSAHFGDFIAWNRLQCLSWSVRPKWRFGGPWGGKTANPLLFANQALDPVTPLRNAVAASELFPGSAVLEQKGVGHCTLSLPSLCTAKVIREYFQTGKVPDNGTKCEVDVRPFWQNEEKNPCDGQGGYLWKALRDMADTFPH